MASQEDPQELHEPVISIQVAELMSNAALPKDPAIRTQLTSLFTADSNREYGPRQNIRIFGVKEEADEHVYPKVHEVAAEAGAPVGREDISNCNWVLSKAISDSEGRPISVKFVRKQTKGLQSSQCKLKDARKRVFSIDDLILLCVRLAKTSHRRSHVAPVSMINGKVCV